MIIRRENFRDYKDEAHSIFVDHWKELGEVGGSTTFSLSADTMCMLADSGNYVSYVARKDDGTIIGYMTYVVTQGIHSSTDTYACTDAVYVVREYRSSLAGIGLKLLKFAEKDLKETFKVSVIQFAMNTAYDLTSFIRKLDYIPSEIRFNKRL